jgi:hypothetical protein
MKDGTVPGKSWVALAAGWLALVARRRTLGP